MVEKSKGKIVTGSLSIAASACLTFTSFTGVISYINYFTRWGTEGLSLTSIFYFTLHITCLLGGIALLVLGILGLIKFSDMNNRKVGMASVISFIGVEFILLLSMIIQNIGYEGIFIDIGLIISLIISIGLLVAFFVCNAKFPIDERKNVSLPPCVNVVEPPVQEENSDVIK